MIESGNMYVLDRSEYIKAGFMNPRTGQVEEQIVRGPCFLRLEGVDVEPQIGAVMSVQIGFSRGREYIVGGRMEDVVFRYEEKE